MSDQAQPEQIIDTTRRGDGRKPTAALCGAQLRGRPGTKCKGLAMPNGRCRLHGGKSLAGMASPKFKTGRHSKYLPRPLVERHESLLENIQIVRKLDEELALLDARISDLCQRLQTGERGTVWQDMQEATTDLQELMDELKTSDEPEVTQVRINEVMERIRQITDVGKSTEQAWQDLDKAIHSKAKVTAIEAKRMADAGEIATRDEVKNLVLCIVNVIHDRVTDPEILKAIATDLHQILGSGYKPVNAKVK